MPNSRFVAVVKSVKPGYDNYLQKIKRISVNQPTQAPFQPNGCKSCKLIIKKGQHLSYDTYLNSIKPNIVKNNLNIGVSIDCKCNIEEPFVNNSNTLYYLENSIFLIDNQENGDNQLLLLDISPLTNIVPIQTMITRYSLSSLSSLNSLL